MHGRLAVETYRAGLNAAASWGGEAPDPGEVFGLTAARSPETSHAAIIAGLYRRHPHWFDTPPASA